MEKCFKLLICFIILCICSCKQAQVIQEQPIELPQTHIDYINHYDSVYIHDSIYQFIEHKDGTLINTKAILKYTYKIKYDTIIVKDTITKPVYITKTEIKTVEVIPWMKISSVLICLIILALIYKFRHYIIQ